MEDAGPPWCSRVSGHWKPKATSTGTFLTTTNQSSRNSTGVIAVNAGIRDGAVAGVAVHSP